MHTVENMLREVMCTAMDTDNEELWAIADTFIDADDAYAASKTGKNRATAHKAHLALRQAWLTNCKG